MKISITGGKGSIELSDDTFGAIFNEPLVHQVITAYRAAGRSGSKRQKNRSFTRMTSPGCTTVSRGMIRGSPAPPRVTSIFFSLAR